MERKPMLTSNELIHLKLFVYGYSKDDFLKFYDLDLKMFPIYHLSIQNKFRTKNWRNIIRRAFRFNLLDKEDFVENSTKKTASDYADVIFEILTSPLKISQKRKEVHDQIIEFLACCNHKLAFHENWDDPRFGCREYYQLTFKEKALIKLLYMEYRDVRTMSKILKVPVVTISYMKEHLLNKLRANSWYNLFRKAFQFNLLDKDEFSSINLTKEISKCAQDITRIKYRIPEETLDHKLNVYIKLLNIFNTYEYDYLLKEDFPERKNNPTNRFEVA